MEDFSELVEVDSEEMKRTHETPTSLSESRIHSILQATFNAVDDQIALYLNDSEVHTRDQAHDSSHDHINKKEIISGDATLWVVTGGERGPDSTEKIDVQYGIYAGSDGDEFIYSPVEVEILPK